MANRTSKKSAKVAKKAAARRVAEKAAKRPSRVVNGEPASRLIDHRIRDVGGWRGETLARMRALILEADPEMTESIRPVLICGRSILTPQVGDFVAKARALGASAALGRLDVDRVSAGSTIGREERSREPWGNGRREDRPARRRPR